MGLDSTRHDRGRSSRRDGGYLEGQGEELGQLVRGEPPPWEIDRPQPVLVQLAVEACCRDACSISAAELASTCCSPPNIGANALGIDISPTAINLAVEKSRRAGSGARFQVGDALRLDRLDELFDVVIDSGMFHTFDADERFAVRVQPGQCLRPDGVLYVTCVSDREPGEAGRDSGPRRVSEDDIRTTFTRGWVVDELRECVRERRPRPRTRGWPRSAAAVSVPITTSSPTDRASYNSDAARAHGK